MSARQIGVLWRCLIVLCASLMLATANAQTPTPADPTPTLAEPASEPGLQSLSSPAEDSVPVPSAPAGQGMFGRLLNSLPQNVLEIVNSLNYWLIPFGIATFLALWFTTERLVVLRHGRVIPGPFVQRFIKLVEDGELDRQEALQICEENGSPVAMVFAHGVRKWGKASVEVEQAIIDGGERQVGSLRKNLRVINGIATITPLIGLLGTVWGMLESFHHISEAGASGNTADLAAGIALALVTTAAGLLIAIPSLISYMYLSGRVDALVMEMDDLAQRVVHVISAEGLEEQAQRPRTVPTDAAKKKAV